MTIIKNNQLETIEALILHISENVENEEFYSYTVSKSEILILDSISNRVILTIFNNTYFDRKNIISIADYYNEAPMEREYQEALDKHKAKYTILAPPMMLFPVRFLPHVVFEYFYSEAIWFQQMTVREDILSYESTWHINTIRKKICENISFFCGGFESREEYENSYEC
jgi:hypothetical protein